MALIECPECKKMISDSAPTCPNCGYLMSNQVELENKFTEISDPKYNKVGGVVCITLGILSILLGIITISLIIGIFVIIGGVILIGTGTGFLKGTCSVNCPYCGKTATMIYGEKNFKCSSCKKISVVDETHLKTVK